MPCCHSKGQGRNDTQGQGQPQFDDNSVLYIYTTCLNANKPIQEQILRFFYIKKNSLKILKYRYHEVAMVTGPVHEVETSPI